VYFLVKAIGYQFRYTASMVNMRMAENEAVEFIWCEVPRFIEMLHVIIVPLVQTAVKEYFKPIIEGNQMATSGNFLRCPTKFYLHKYDCLSAYGKVSEPCNLPELQCTDAKGGERKGKICRRRLNNRVKSNAACDTAKFEPIFALSCYLRNTIMRVAVIRKAHFNAAHRLHVPNWSDERNREVFGLCNSPNYHGHNYELDVKVTGEVDPVTGMVIDLGVLAQLIKDHVELRFDHKNLNLDVPDFQDLIPSAEHIAFRIYEILKAQLPPHLDLHVRLYETPRNFVEYPA
jgi:6-pyruvoyltetrahydropterin/6-carboxytetrahydropterin synthase